MAKTNGHIPIYGLENFGSSASAGREFQVEPFDANRHFSVEYPHRHDFYEVLYLSGGSGFHIIDSNRYKIEPPCIFFMTPGQTHKLELSHDIQGYIFLFSANFYLLSDSNKNKLLGFPFFHSISRQNPPLQLLHESDIFFIKSLFARGCAEVKSPGCSSEIIRSLLDLILLTCHKLYPQEANDLAQSKGHFLVKRFMLLIEENYQGNLKVNDYANRLAITPNHLTQVIKQITGKTTIDILHERNILEIKRLLLYTNLTVTEIATRMNFVDQSYFTKYFRKATGQTPMEFRQAPAKNK